MSKAEKHMGLPLHAAERRAPAMPDKVTPKRKDKRVERPYGYSFVWKGFGALPRTKLTFRWFRSERGRDQSLEHELRERDKYEKQYGYYWYSDFRRVQRR